MNHLKMIGLAAVATMAMTAVSVASASATILEIGGTAQSGALAITASGESSITLGDTEKIPLNTCKVSSVTVSTTSPTGTKVTGPISTLSFSTCEVSPVTVEAKGNLYVEWEGSSAKTSGSVFSEGTAVTWNTSFGFHVTCTTPVSGTKIGTLDGVASGNATMTIAAVFYCGFLIPSASWTGTYKVTTPTGLGVANGTTTLEIGGVAQNKAVEIEASAASGIVLSDTEGVSANTCSASSVAGTTTSTSGTKVTGPVSTLSFGTCEYSPVTVETKGSLYIEHETGTTSGSVFSEGAAVTVNTSFGFHVTCTTASTGTKIGTLDGKAKTTEHATMTIAAVLSCGFLMPSASWSGTYKVSTPTGLGVVA